MEMISSLNFHDNMICIVSYHSHNNENLIIKKLFVLNFSLQPNTTCSNGNELQWILLRDILTKITLTFHYYSNTLVSISKQFVKIKTNTQIMINQPILRRY